MGAQYNMQQLKLILVVMISNLAMVNLGLAQDKDTSRERAKAFYASGQKAFKAERYGEAFSYFKKAYETKNIPGLLVNIARIYEATNDLKNAIKFQKLYKKAAPKKAKQVSKKIGMLRATHASWPAVRITSQPSGQTIRVASMDRPIIGKTPMRLKLPVGKHSVWVGTGNGAVSKSIVFSQGRNTSVNFVLQQRVGSAPSTNIPSRIATKGTFISVTVNLAGSQVRLDNKLVGVTPISTPIKVTAGKHKLQVESPSGEVHEETVNVGFGQTRQVLVVLDDSSSPKGRSNMIAWGSIGLGGASLLAGTAVGLMALDANAKLEDCRASTCAGTNEEVKFADDVRSKAQLADILWGCGIALGTVGTILWFQDGPSESSRSARLKPSQQSHWDTGSVWSGEK